jgi:hypothetical protein
MNFSCLPRRAGHAQFARLLGARPNAIHYGISDGKPDRDSIYYSLPSGVPSFPPWQDCALAFLGLFVWAGAGGITTDTSGGA